MKYYSAKINHYLDKTKSLANYYLIDEKGITIYASSQDKLNNKPEFVLPYNQLESFKMFIKKNKPSELLSVYKQGKYNSIEYSNSKTEGQIKDKKNLTGYKIAIDPGHTAGTLKEGKLEQKFLKFNILNENNKIDSIEIAEGMLTFATATLLKTKLENEGAQVFMTRTFNGGSAFGLSFDDWLKKYYTSTVDSLYKINEINAERKNWLLTKATKREKFKLVFKDLELKKRAELINNYQPDFTIIIHYNVDETNTGWTKPTDKNYVMTFVGGAFMKSDMTTQAKRLEFFRLLVTDDLEQSIDLSSATVKSFEKTLLVKAATIKDAKYLKEGCIAATSEGVYCRNLQLTRYVHSPLVYGETLYQDNINECKLLNREKDKTKNERVQQVATAYYQGILDYIYKLPSKE